MHSISEHSSNDLHKEHVTSFNHHILAENLSFSYDTQTQVLNEMNCIIEKGKKYVVVGKSGCGKSTFIKLLTGYYSDYKGTLLYDDRELTQLVKEDVVQLSSIIHQNIYLFNETIFDNICLHEDYPKEMIDKVVKESGLDKFISELPNGLFYQVGENGSNLSGGQKQRIAVARALIRNKPILILDEGTSAIDMQTAYDIESRLLKMNDLTLIKGIGTAGYGLCLSATDMAKIGQLCLDKGVHNGKQIVSSEWIEQMTRLIINAEKNLEICLMGIYGGL